MKSIEEIKVAILDLQTKQSELGIDFGPQIKVLQDRLSVLQSGSGAVAFNGVAGGQDSVVVGRDVGGDVVVVKDGGTVIFPDAQPIAMTAVEEESMLGRYLSHVISRNRYLQLQGIRSGGRLVNIELEHIYITLKATATRTGAMEEKWLAMEQETGPGERLRPGDAPGSEIVTVKVEQALSEHRHLVVLGNPGSGKTTLMRYLALCYARDRAEQDQSVVKKRLGLDERGYLPILLPLRNFGAFLRVQHPADDGTNGHTRLLAFLSAYLAGERITLPANFFDEAFTGGQAIILFDGMDEVGDFDLRRRVTRMIEGFARSYRQCRIVVTSRVVGYEGAARLGVGFSTTTVRNFSLRDVEKFLSQWHRLVAIGQMGPTETAERFAASQTQQLLQAIKGNPRVRELAINPLMLTVIALVHRDRVKLPERRAELYAEAIDVLLGKWDEARGVEGFKILDEREFDTTDRRLLLQSVALDMQEKGKKEIEAGALQEFLIEAFKNATADGRSAERAADRFLKVIQERTGLLVEAGPANYRFSHLTFQEYLAAVAVAERDDYINFTLEHGGEAFWREVILLETGYLSTKNMDKASRLIRAIADCKKEPELFHNRVLAAECIRDLGESRIDRKLIEKVIESLREELERSTSAVGAIFKRVTGRVSTSERQRAAVSALGQIEAGQQGSTSPYWSLPYGEPNWISVPEGEFWMGSVEADKDAYENEKPQHRFPLPQYKIAKTPVTNAQYTIYAEATDASVPEDWEDRKPPADRLHHPVVGVTWHDALTYCRWLSKVTGQRITLPSEAEWEKAARGDQDARPFPWGNKFDPLKCNCRELELEETSPVGVFRNGASPYGCLDMAGNVWEWTRSLWGKDVGKLDFRYPYKADDGRENLNASDDYLRVLRGGAFGNSRQNLRCAFRLGYFPYFRFRCIGFRVVLLPSNSDL